MRLPFTRFIKEAKFLNFISQNDGIFFYCSVSAVFLLLAMAVGIRFFLPGAADLISLHYNIYAGIDRVGAHRDIWVYFFAGFLFFIINEFLSIRFLVKKDRFIGRLVSGFNVGILTLLSLALFFIIFLNR